MAETRKNAAGGGGGGTTTFTIKAQFDDPAEGDSYVDVLGAAATLKCITIVAENQGRFEAVVYVGDPATANSQTGGTDIRNAGVKAEIGDDQSYRKLQELTELALWSKSISISNFFRIEVGPQPRNTGKVTVIAELEYAT